MPFPLYRSARAPWFSHVKPFSRRSSAVSLTIFSFRTTTIAVPVCNRRLAGHSSRPFHCRLPMQRDPYPLPCQVHAWVIIAPPHSINTGSSPELSIQRPGIDRRTGNSDPSSPCQLRSVADITCFRNVVPALPYTFSDSGNCYFRIGQAKKKQNDVIAYFVAIRGCGADILFPIAFVSNAKLSPPRRACDISCSIKRPAFTAAASGMKGDKPAAIRSALIKCGHCASCGQKGTGKGGFPCPVWPRDDDYFLAHRSAPSSLPEVLWAIIKQRLIVAASKPQRPNSKIITFRVTNSCNPARCRCDKRSVLHIHGSTCLIRLPPLISRPARIFTHRAIDVQPICCSNHAMLLIRHVDVLSKMTGLAEL